MTNQPAEIISGEKARELLRYLIDSRHLCKIRIPNTPYCWITLLSDIKKEEHSQSLLIDGVPGFGEALSHSKNREVTLEYMDRGGVLCYFNARVGKILPKMIWVECPGVIYRVQRRTFYRLKAPGGTEIFFPIAPDKEERAEVRDYSLAGVAFLTRRPLPLKTGDQIKDLSLKIPEDKDRLIIPIPLAVVRRVDSQAQPGAFLYALEFLQMLDTTRKRLARHIFEKQRLLLRKFGKNLSLPNPF